MYPHPKELIAQGVPLQIEIASNNYRLMAALVEHPEGWVFADIGWCDPLCSFHPFHLIKGELTGDDPWDLGGFVIRRVLNGPSWNAWLDYAVEQRCNQVAAERAIRISYDLDRETGTAS